MRPRQLQQGAPRLAIGPLRRRARVARILSTLHRVAEALENASDPEAAMWAALVGLTAGEGLGLNRAFLVLLDRDGARGWFGVGPRTGSEAAAVWSSIREQPIGPMEALRQPDRAVIAAERARHSELLERLGHPLSPGCTTWRRAFVARPGHPNECVRHWLSALESEALLVVPMAGPDGPTGALVADNFVTRAPISSAVIEGAQTVALALQAALERTRLVSDLEVEHRRRVVAEHATTMLETARTLAHDLKNPLALAGGLARETLAAPPAHGSVLSARLASIAAAIQRTEERLSELAERLASRAIRVDVAPLDVGAVVDKIVASFRPLAESRGIRLQFYRPAREVEAMAEPSLLERCIENLAGNGLNALRESRVCSPIVRVAIFTGAETVRIEVADNGPPLPPQLRHDPFSGHLAGHRAGAGLGLVSVRRLADAMGGDVEYDEKEPGWVRFTVVLRRPP
ncbi:MAG: sensor histidine kinase [Acidobacteriota bacterium]